MALTKFVRNVEDLSDKGGYKFRFRCDKCNDGFESQFISSSANVLRGGMAVFSMLRPFGWGAREAADEVSRGLQGKEHDQAYEKAVHEAMVHFKKCTACGQWVCPENCWNAKFGMCEACAPDEGEAYAKQAAEQARQKAVEAAQAAGATSVANLQSCPTCGTQNRGSKFCTKCGTSMAVQSAHCGNCGKPMAVDAGFCGECGSPVQR
jgi:Double zinc ribbon